jgi:biopolymer transport protein ExbB
LLIEYIRDGGVVMIPIALCSVVAVATFLERIWTLRRERVVPRSFVVELFELVGQRRWADASTLCRKRQASVARVAEIALDVRQEPRSVAKERVEEVGRREAAEMERYVPILGTIASIAPLLGLLGTVGGMIVTFEVIQDQQGVKDVADLAGGISQALITTFAGLSVGIPAVVANRYVLARIDALLIDLEEVSLSLLQLLEDARAQPEGDA